MPTQAVAACGKKKEDHDKAIADYTKVIEIDPKNTVAYVSRGYAWGEKGDNDKAIADFTKAIEIDPKYALAYYYHGRAWRKKGDYDKATADFNKAIEIDAECTYAYAGLAWLMATCPIDKYRDGKRGVELAEKSIKQKEIPFTLDILAAAYAEVGRLPEAIQTQERAITELKKTTAYEKDLAKYEEHLASYKAGKPWREK